jgi:hypothetical protein
MATLKIMQKSFGRSMPIGFREHYAEEQGCQIYLGA